MFFQWRGIAMFARLSLFIWFASAALFVSPALAAAQHATFFSQQDDEEKKPVPPMKEWKKEVDQRIAKDDRLKKLAAKHPVALLHSRSQYAKGGRLGMSAFSFLFETADDKAHGNFAEMIFNGGRKPLIIASGRSCLIVDLGETDFEKDPDPKKISVTHPGFSPSEAEAKEGHVFLERVRDELGNHFYALFEVILVDPDSRYVAFFWRKLPGGKIVFPDRPNLGRRPGPDPGAYVGLQEKTAATQKVWQDKVRKGVLKNDKLKALTMKYPLAFLDSAEFDNGDPESDTSNFGFVFGDTNYQKHSDRQLWFTGGLENNFRLAGNQAHFVVDLGKKDFENDPDPEKISIDHPGVSGHGGTAKEGRVYLLHVRTKRGSDFYVVFQVIAIESEGNHLAFIWRRIPGGKLVK
jgi:hypothetical protein